VRILYSAIDQTVPGTFGGAVHVQSVAEGLAALGHEVHALTAKGAPEWPRDGVHWHDVEAPGGRPQFRLLAARDVTRVARAVEPDIVVERYHNFGGEGMLAARATGARYVLEVNAPIVDYPGSPKARVDRALVVQPMRRWRDRQVRAADLIVSPSTAILPPWVPASRVLEVEWGADTARFRPDAAGQLAWHRGSTGMTAIFAGAFRPWHGAVQLVEAIRLLRARGVADVRAVLVGDGPERAAAQEAARGLGEVVFTGALAHARMPAALAAADVGVAPFDVARHPPLQLGFYWSPLKVFEYMASGLPVVAPALPRLRSLVADGVEGVLYEPATPAALAGALASLRDPGRRAQLGAAARLRAERDYSWLAHCARLDAAFRALVARTRNS
jgi:glycosyltransferase involved in cell wall biosynthesis